MSLGAFVVTGAGSGIGLAIAQEIISQGHHVLGLGRDLTKLEKAAREMGSFTPIATDLSSASQADKALESIRNQLKELKLPLLGLVNNAGVVDRLPFIESADQIWERQFQNNLMSAVRLTRGLYPLLKAAPLSSVLNVSSNLGVRPIVNTSAYSAIKAAMVNWTHSLALEWAADKIRVNCICPGLVDTPIHSFHSLPADHETKLQGHSIVPLGRMGLAPDISKAAWFLLSENSSWTTGAVLNVDGGLSL